MNRRNVVARVIGAAARKFRSLQEIWILPWWGDGRFATPLWAVDILVLMVKLVSTCTVAVARFLIPPVMKSLHGETVLITGSANGLGRELALQMAELGATVICWDKEARRNNSVVAEIVKKGGDSFGFTIDVTAREQVAALSARMRRQLCDVSMVISNAGALTAAPFAHLRPDSVSHHIEVNLLAHFWILQAFLPSMIEKRHGHIVAINSSAGLMPCPDMIPYCAAKFGLRGLMDSIAEELRLDTWTKDINVTSVYLATVATGLYPPPTHRFRAWYGELAPKDVARIIIEGIRRNRRTICIPWFMKTLVDFTSLLPERIRFIYTDFINFGHRGWFCFC